jgi:hypothetical protein
MTTRIFILFLILACSAVGLSNDQESEKQEIDVISRLAITEELEEESEEIKDESSDRLLDNELEKLDKNSDQVNLPATDQQDAAKLPPLDELKSNNNEIVESSNLNFKNFALIRVLNKITTKSFELKLAKQKPYDFGKLKITVSYCWQSTPNIKTENKVFLNIEEQLDQNHLTEIFSGWLMSSSPSISAVEHPIYDVHLLKCFD